MDRIRFVQMDIRFNWFRWIGLDLIQGETDQKESPEEIFDGEKAREKEKDVVGHLKQKRAKPSFLLHIK